MRLITFEDSARRSRIGALAPDERLVDLNSACALYLREVENESAFYRLADALVPPDMRELFSGADTSLEAARKAFDYVLGSASVTAPRGEPIFYSADEVALKAPIAPRKFFHAAGFRNVDAIIGHEEPVVYPEHLTQELDCEIELAIVLKKSGKHFAPEDAAGYVGGYVIFNRITARDIQRREMKSGGTRPLQRARHVLSVGPVDRDRRRDSRPACPGHGTASERRAPATFKFQQNVGEDSGSSFQLFAHGLQRGRRGFCRHDFRLDRARRRCNSLASQSR